MGKAAGKIDNDQNQNCRKLNNYRMSHKSVRVCTPRLCHWSFDEGLMGVGKDYEVLVSRRVRTEQNYLGHILTLIDRPIFKPAEQIYWPTRII